MLYSSLKVHHFEGNVQPLSQAKNKQEAGGKHVELLLLFFFGPEDGGSTFL
jgi:hypothetical protein